MLEFMSDATSIPILLDGDTGYGDFNNMRRLVKKLEQRNIAGVCIEDKLFPKTNSFIQGERQPLEDIGTFCGKIKAGKDSQSDEHFNIVARVEALIAGWGLDEALTRAEAYREAGADAILIHSKQSRPDEVLEFARHWDNRAPLVIVPTKYYSTPADVFREAGVSMVIWANHLMRAGIAAMQAVAAEIKESESLVDSEGRIATVSEIFRLQGAEELLDAEKIYARPGHAAASAVILAASRGENLGELTKDKPKVMIPVAGKPVLRRLVDKFKQQGVNEITAVAGFGHSEIDVQGINIIVNEQWEHSGELASLYHARDAFEDNTVLIYGDLLFRSYILHNLLDWDAEILAVVDSSPLSGIEGNVNDLAYCSAVDNRAMYQQQVSLEQVSSDVDWQGRDPDGRWVGMLRVAGQGRAKVLTALESLKQQSDFDRMGIPDLLNHLVAEGSKVQVQYISGHWLDINNLEDLQRANEFTIGRET
jgi:phosphoenolpyruvate phosphomutase